MDRIAVLIPCFNEERTIGKVVTDFKKTLPDAAVYVYDNNSNDRTAAVARDAGAIVRKNPSRQGKCDSSDVSGSGCRVLYYGGWR